MDPEGYYARLGVASDAGSEAILAAYRRKARVLHPDVPGTGNAAAFILVHEAYEVLGDEISRARYDRAARDQAVREPAPDWTVPPEEELPPLPPLLRVSRRLRIGLWVGLGALTVISLVELVFHLVRLSEMPSLPGLAAGVEPPAPATGAAAMVPVGQPTHYVLPTAGPAPLWRFDAAHNGYVPAGRLDPFAGVELLPTPQHDGMVEVRVSAGHGFMDATRLAPGDAVAARRAYCSYNAGPALVGGEVLTRHGNGDGILGIDNANPDPVVLKLRDAQGATMLSVVANRGATTVTGLAPGNYTAEYASGTLWSRACGSFVAGARSWRLPAPIQVSDDTHLAIPAPDAAETPPDTFSSD